jgi:hypothetical protein
MSGADVRAGGAFTTVGEALAAVEAALGFLAAADVASWPAEALAGSLRALGRVEAGQLAAQSRLLAVFNAQAGFEADGQASVKAWLRWQAQMTRGGSSGAVGWMRTWSCWRRRCGSGPRRRTPTGRTAAQRTRTDSKTGESG